MSQKLRVFDMFCGGGGSSVGAVMAGAEPVAALDMWDMAADTYRKNFPHAMVYNEKASSLMPREIADEVGQIDVLLASPECSSHSPAKGNKPRCDDSRATAFEVVRFAKVMKPRWIIVENVMQMLHWERFVEWHSKLHEIGYKTTVGKIEAQYHDTAQSRSRLFIVGSLETVPQLPGRKKHTTRTVRNSVLGRGEPETQPWKFSPLNKSTRARATIDRAERAIRRLGPDEPFIMVYYGSDGAGGFQKLDRPLRTVTTVDRFAYVRPNGRTYEMRMLQPLELAAAMGFPRCHVWPKASRRNRIKMIGNAVCPRVMRDVMLALVSNQA